MGWDCLAYKSYWFSVSCTVGHTTGSRNIKPEVVFKVHKMARYVSFCLIMGPFKGELPVFPRLSPIWPPWHALRRLLTLAGLAILGLGLWLVLRWGSTFGHPSNSWASCLYVDWICFLFPHHYLMCHHCHVIHVVISCFSSGSRRNKQHNNRAK